LPFAIRCSVNWQAFALFIVLSTLPFTPYTFLFFIPNYEWRDTNHEFTLYSFHFLQYN